MLDQAELIIDEDGWERIRESRYATRREFAGVVRPDSEQIDEIVISALARAADADGLLLDFDPQWFYEDSVAAVVGVPLTFDALTFLVVSSIQLRLVELGLLGTRVPEPGGLRIDMRLLLPTHRVNA